MIKPQCLDSTNKLKNRVDSKFCNEKDKPAPRFQDCYNDEEYAELVEKCPPTWLSRPWSHCDCETMQRKRQVSCWKILRKGVLSTVSDQVCESGAKGVKPVNIEGCICTKAQEQLVALTVEVNEVKPLKTLVNN